MTPSFEEFFEALTEYGVKGQYVNECKALYDAMTQPEELRPMSDRKIITFEQFKKNCGISSMPYLPPDSCLNLLCDAQSCPAFNAFQDAEPIIEAANRYWHENTSKLHRMDELRAALDAVKVKP